MIDSSHLQNHTKLMNYCLTTALACVSAVSITHADDVANLAGTWAEHNIETPAALIETYYNIDTQQTRMSENSQDYARQGEMLVDTYFTSEFQAESNSLTISTDGSFTSSDDTGQILDFNRGRILIKSDDESLADSIPVFVNMASDILVATLGDSFSKELAIVLREPDSLTVNELNGDWGIGTSSMPSTMTESYYDGANNRFSDISGHATTGEQLVDLQRQEQFENHWGNLTFNNGAFSGLFTGSLSVQGNKVIVTPDDEDADPMTMSINQSKDVIVHTELEPGESMELIVLARKPASLSLADLEGTWRVATLMVPVKLEETYYNADAGTSRTGDINDFAGSGGQAEQLVDLYYTSRYQTEQGTIEVDSSGNVTGLFSGVFSVVGGNSLSFSDGEEAAPIFINASKNFAYNFSLDTEDLSMHVLTKVSIDFPETFEELVDMREVEVDGQKVYTLNGGNNLKVASSTDLEGSPSTWGESGAPEGTSIIAPGAYGTKSEFYSVTPRVETVD